MWKNDTFNEIGRLLLQRQLGEAVKSFENFFLTHPGNSSKEAYLLCQSHYDLMVDYWKRGYDDPEREKLYDNLLHKAHELLGEMTQRERNEHSAFRMTLRREALLYRKDWSATAVKAELEGFVSDIAMLSLEPEHQRKEHHKELYRRHQRFMRIAFSYIWTAELWHQSDSEVFTDMLLSPTVDAIDQQLLVSAVTMATLNLFDVNKFKTLAQVYRRATVEQVRQRALVGMVLVADANYSQLYDEMQEVIDNLCDDEQCCSEMAELQMQLVFCMEAESDTQRIKNEIMPDLLNHSNLKITRQGIVETDDDALEDILHPDAAEQNMEKMEESMKKMVDMQQQGADIYFGGFSQMKRFPFFDDVSNWLVPFYSQHPGISEIWNQAKGKKMLHLITRVGAFCDSDKYSFILAFQHVLDRLPKGMLDMIEQGEAVPTPVGGEIAFEEQNKPAFIRRVYLQNLYRFFKLYPMRSEFRSPFTEEESSGYLFFTNPLFSSTPLQKHYVRIASFLAKRRLYAAAMRVLQCCSEQIKDYKYYMMMGTLAKHDRETAVDNGLAERCFRMAVKLKPDSERALSGLARALFNGRNYAEAFDVYERLLLINDRQAVYELGSAVCLLSLGRHDEALQRLYKLSYDHPDDVQVKRSLAWALVLGGKYEQAEKHYEQLLAAEAIVADDILNHGYCLWLQHRVGQAVGEFRRIRKSEEIDLKEEFLHAEREMLHRHGIGDVEIQLMLEAVCVHSWKE